MTGSWLDVPAGIACIVLAFVGWAIIHRRNVIRDRRWINTWAEDSARARRNARKDGAS